MLFARGIRLFPALSNQRAQGKPDADCTRGRAQKAHEWTTGSTGSFRLSLRNGLGLIRALPGDRAFLPPSPCGLTIHRKPGWAGCISATLDASIGASGPHDFAIRARLAKGSCRTSCDPASSGEDGWQRRSSARRRSLTGNPPCDPPCARRCRVHRIPSRVDDVGQRPSFGMGGQIIQLNFYF